MAGEDPTKTGQDPSPDPTPALEPEPAPEPEPDDKHGQPGINREK